MLSLVNYLFEITAWKRESVKSNVSNKDLATLTKSGIRKPVTTYLSGFSRGTDNINAKNRMRLDSGWDKKEHVSGRSNNGLREQRPKKTQDTDFLSHRHESGEGKYERIKTSNGMPLGGGLTHIMIGRENSKESEPRGRVGLHSSPRIPIEDEKNVKQLTSIYPHLKNQSNVKKFIEHDKTVKEMGYEPNVSEKEAKKIDKKQVKGLKDNKNFHDYINSGADEEHLIDKLKQSKHKNNPELIKKREEATKTYDELYPKVAKDIEKFKKVYLNKIEQPKKKNNKTSEAPQENNKPQKTPEQQKKEHSDFAEKLRRKITPTFFERMSDKFKRK